MSRQSMLALLVPLAIAACGGETASGGAHDAAPADDSSDATTSDAAPTDAGIDAPHDAADARVPQDGDCPQPFPTTCTAGETCRLDCNLCSCDVQLGAWGCTTKACNP